MATRTTSASTCCGSPPLDGSTVRVMPALPAAAPGDLGAELEGEALLAQDALHLLGHFAVQTRQDAVEILDHRHFGAQAAPDGRQFQPDDAAADHREALRHFRQFKRAGGGHDALLVHLDAGDRDQFRTGGDDDVLGADNLGAAITLDGDFALGGDAALALEPVDLVLLEQELDAGGVVFDDLVLVGHHGRQVQLDRAELDAMTREGVLGFLELLGTGQQRLGRDAADIEAGAAQRLALFDAGRLQAKLCGADGGNITAGSTADDDNVVGFLRHLFFFASVGSSRAGHALRLRFMALQAARGNLSNCAQTHGNGWIPALPRCLGRMGGTHAAMGRMGTGDGLASL